MMKKLTILVFAVFLTISCQKMQVQDYSDGIVHTMINNENNRIKNSQDLRFFKSLHYNGDSNTTEVQPKEVFKLDSTLLALNPDKYFNHSGYSKIKRSVNGITELKLLRKQDEKAPLRMIDCYFYESGDSIIWKALYIEKEDKNILFHNIQTYILDFNKGLLSDISMHTIQKSLYGSSQDFRVSFAIRRGH